MFSSGSGEPRRFESEQGETSQTFGNPQDDPSRLVLREKGVVLDLSGSMESRYPSGQDVLMRQRWISRAKNEYVE